MALRSRAVTAMGVEIERKFMVQGDGWRRGDAGTPIVQGYLAASRERSVRVRLTPDAAWLTVKGPSEGAVRPEFEYPIPRADAEQILALCSGVLEKTRHRIPAGDLTWEVDEFGGANRGLVLAEIELTRPDQEFARPPWLGAEVTGDPGYSNARLAHEPRAGGDTRPGPAAKE
jgi:adenylate cyclase